MPHNAHALGSNPFTLGVASGDPLPDGVVLWTRLAPDPTAEDGLGGMDPLPVDVRWEIAADDGFRQAVASGSETARPELAHSVHVDATGLRPATEYFYRFMAGNEVSPVGRTKTAPAAGASVDRLRFAVCSCAHWEHGWYTAYRGVAGEDVDLVFHLGDYIYEYPSSGEFLPSSGAIVRQHLGGEVMSLADYRRRHAQYKTDRDLQAAHAAAPWAVTWDDHETANDYAGVYTRDGETSDAFLERRANAYQAYYEHMPLRPESMPTGPDMRLYRSLTYGTLAEFSILDTRQYRSGHPCGDGLLPLCPAAFDPAVSLTGSEQERWLLAGLDESTATWNVIAQQVPMVQCDTRPGPDGVFLTDLWDGYPAARERILAHVHDAGIGNAVVLSGDVHSSWVNDLKVDFGDPEAPAVATEFVGTSISSEGDLSPAERLRIGAAASVIRSENPHVHFFDGVHRGYLRVEVTPELWRTDLRFVESVSQPESSVATGASFVVEAGRPGALPG
jgi:alkaline phosphatase D